MKSILNDMPFFVEVAKQKSFTLAADILEMPVSTLSRRISAMEKALGVPLLYRNSRNVELTESGKAFFEDCDYIVSSAKNACEAVVQNLNAPSGVVRFSVPLDSYLFLMDALKDFAAFWPEIQLDIRFSDRLTDLIVEPYDLELRLGPLPDSTLRARLLSTVPNAIYASPKLLEFYPSVNSPEDLLKMPCIYCAPQGNIWHLHKGKETRSITIKPAHTFNSMFASMDFAIAGLGAICMAHPLAFPHLQNGELVRILPDWHLPIAEIYLVMANHQLPYRVRLLIEHLIAYSDQLEKEFFRVSASQSGNLNI